jgi:hypothetical protein
MENQNQIVELTQAETEQVEGGFPIVAFLVWGAIDSAIWGYAFSQM